MLFILDTLQVPTKLELARNCCVAINLPHGGGSHKPFKCRSNPKKVTSEMQVKSFPKECFSVSAEKLFYTVCKEELSVKASMLQQHVKVLNT